MFGGIEAGGTKFVCGVGSGPGDFTFESFATTTPTETIPRLVEFLRRAGSELRSVGVGSFGPVDLDPDSPTYGYITSTPKIAWAQYDLRGAIERALGVPVGFDTDVNASLLGEARWGAARGVSDAIYITIGTGVGGGAIAGGQVVRGLVHPEMGHLLLRHDLTKDPFPGTCPYHADCFEGLACGPAMEARWGVAAKHLAESHPAWQLEADYIAQGLANLMVTLSPKRIILGGGVMQAAHLFPLIRNAFVSLLNGYVRHPKVIETVEELIVPPALGSQAGVLGCFVLAERALQAAN